MKRVAGQIGSAKYGKSGRRSEQTPIPGRGHVRALIIPEFGWRRMADKTQKQQKDRSRCEDRFFFKMSSFCVGLSKHHILISETEIMLCADFPARMN